MFQVCGRLTDWPAGAAKIQPDASPEPRGARAKLPVRVEIGATRAEPRRVRQCAQRENARRTASLRGLPLCCTEPTALV